MYIFIDGNDGIMRKIQLFYNYYIQYKSIAINI